MAKPTFASVTAVPCTCGYLDQMSRDPNVPVKFVPEVNEYHLEHAVRKRGKLFLVIYHCPFCGGTAPQSRRGEMFAAIPVEEAKRLKSLVRDIRTPEDALRILGKPDEDRPVKVSPGTKPRSKIGKLRRNRAMTFSNVSDVADIQVTTGSDNKVQLVIAPKYTRII